MTAVSVRESSPKGLPTVQLLGRAVRHGHLDDHVMRLPADVSANDSESNLDSGTFSRLLEPEFVWA